MAGQGKPDSRLGLSSHGGLTKSSLLSSKMSTQGSLTRSTLMSASKLQSPLGKTGISANSGLTSFGTGQTKTLMSATEMAKKKESEKRGKREELVGRLNNLSLLSSSLLSSSKLTSGPTGLLSKAGETGKLGLGGKSLLSTGLTTSGLGSSGLTSNLLSSGLSTRSTGAAYGSSHAAGQSMAPTFSLSLTTGSSLLGGNLGTSALGGKSLGTVSHGQTSHQPQLRQRDATKRSKSRGKPSKRDTTTTASVPSKRIVVDDFEIPEYDFESDSSDSGISMPAFLPAERDESLMKLTTPVHDVMSMKRSLINAVSASLLRSPNFKEPKDPVRLDLIAMVDKVSYYDGEFALKVALYTRCGLNIRTTGDFLLAYASYNKACRPYLRRYFSATIRLPSDWIDVAEMYQAFYDKNINFGSLPAALRRAMVAKFTDFDQYQLGKYNKDKTKKKKVPTATLR